MLVEVIHLAFCASGMLILRFRSLWAVESLMGHQIVHRCEFDAACGADQLNQWRRWRFRRRWTRARIFPCLTVMLFVRNEVLVAAKYNIALLTPEA